MNVRTLAIAAVCLVVIFVAFRPSSDSYEIRNANVDGETIIAFGDSLTHGIGASKDMDYPSQLSRMIGKPVVNMGVPGETTADALQRLDLVLVENPGVVIVTLGGNDIRRKVPKEQAFNNLRTIVERIQESGALVVLGGIDVPVFGSNFGDAYKTLARDTGSLLVPNVFAGVITNKALMSDPVHPNGKGYKVMAEAFQQVLSPYIN